MKQLPHELDLLLRRYADANFDCGEADTGDPNWDEMFANAMTAEKELVEYLHKLIEKGSNS